MYVTSKLQITVCESCEGIEGTNDGSQTCANGAGTEVCSGEDPIKYKKINIKLIQEITYNYCQV